MSNKKTNQSGRKAVLLRLIRMLFSFYPVLLPVTLVCILFNAVISSVPSIFMQKCHSRCGNKLADRRLGERIRTDFEHCLPVLAGFYAAEPFGRILHTRS